MGRIFILVSLFFAGVALCGQTSQEALENLAVQIAQKRSDAETLNNQLDLKKTGYNEELRSIATQKADIEARIKRQELQMVQLERELGEYSDRIAQSRVRMSEIKPVIIDVIGYLREYVSSSLPFHTEDRLNELDGLERILTADRIPESDALARLWNILEEESRLCRETGLYRQTITLNGEEQLAEVARLGMVFLYFRTFDGKYGYAVQENAQWHYEEAKSGDDEQRIEQLFASLKKNLREGYFELPLPSSGE